MGHHQCPYDFLSLALAVETRLAAPKAVVMSHALLAEM